VPEQNNLQARSAPTQTSADGGAGGFYSPESSKGRDGQMV